jgi:hypothetical protein
MHWQWNWHVFLWCVCAGIAFTVAEIIRRRENRRAQLRRIWQCCRYQGGANVYTPHPMSEEDAIEFASALGSILWVDREHGFIFYRPLSGV